MTPLRSKTLKGWAGSRVGIALVVYLAVAAFLLIYEHRAHIPGNYWLLGALLLACLLTHRFMHSGHKNHVRPTKEPE